MELNKGFVMKGEDECGRFCVRGLRRGIRPYENIEETRERRRERELKKMHHNSLMRD